MDTHIYAQIMNDMLWLTLVYLYGWTGMRWPFVIYTCKLYIDIDIMMCPGNVWLKQFSACRVYFLEDTYTCTDGDVSQLTFAHFIGATIPASLPIAPGATSESAASIAIWSQHDKANHRSSDFKSWCSYHYNGSPKSFSQNQYILSRSSLIDWQVYLFHSMVIHLHFIRKAAYPNIFRRTAQTARTPSKDKNLENRLRVDCIKRL